MKLEETHFQVLIDQGRIQERIAGLAELISLDYQARNLHLVGVLRGAYRFTRDLSARISIPHSVDFISVASYGEETESSGRIQLRMDVSAPVRGKDLLIVEDIVDTGLTLRWLVDHLRACGPRSIKTCCLLNKPARRKQRVPIDYMGFQIDDLFVVGYGLDYQEKFRELPFISCLAPGQAA